MSDPVTLFFVASAAATSAYGTVQAGKAQAYQYKAEANQAKMQARDMEIARRQKLLQALANRQVVTAAGGATLEGTPGVLITASEQAANMDALSLEGMTASRVANLNAAARNARMTANISAGAQVLAAAAAASNTIAGPSGGASAPGASAGSSPPGALGRITPKGGAGLIPR